MALGVDTKPPLIQTFFFFLLRRHRRRRRQNEKTRRAEVDGLRLPDLLQTRAAAVLASADGVCQQHGVLLMVLF